MCVVRDYDQTTRFLQSSPPTHEGFLNKIILRRVPFANKMASKPMMKKAIALTEKKMDMALDDIIKMSKTDGPKVKRNRLPNKSQRNFSNANQQKSMRFKQYVNSRSSIRQGVLAQRRSNFPGSQFPLTNEAAKRASALPFRNGFSIRGGRGNPNRGRYNIVPVSPEQFM